ncbi:hypothetical protein ATM97_24340 [Nocardia sp. MH4]|uniref:hypothetical protein n=1 Tax=Nocardia sp. MH4 TaxID=1768677 RepID=UPI001C4EFCE3|nr:hypothetical protein [Nocardia sp. MH4]MBW0273216.1 hypothetical protein [Nocardia sp. MH4]
MSRSPIPELTPYPTIKGKQGAINWYRDALGVEFKYNELDRKTSSGELPSFMVSGSLWYATQDLMDYLMSKRRAAQPEQVSA